MLKTEMRNPNTMHIDRCDTEEILRPGDCHYCPQGHSHSFINESDADLIFLGVVPEHNLAAE